VGWKKKKNRMEGTDGRKDGAKAMTVNDGKKK
jgi:hypothetical protein